MGKTVRYFNKKDEGKTEGPTKQISKKKKPKKDLADLSSNSEKIVTFDVTNKIKNFKPYAKKFTKKKKIKPNPSPKFPGRAPVDGKALEKHDRGDGVDEKTMKLNINKLKMKQKEKAVAFSIEQAARTEILMTENTGDLEADAGETTTQFRQHEIAHSVDITAATKHFELHLRDFGPYRMNYTRNGRHLLLGGKKGHVAAMDWVTKKLHCEFNVMESVHDVCWLHFETMMAVAQQKWVYIYDNQGIELHCLKKLNKISRMEFLPYHFLLATASEEGYLSWLDISIGQMVSQFNTRFGRLSMMCQNPQNAILCLGSTKGVVSMWSPNVREPLAKLLCHRTAMTALHVDPKGNYMATAATDNSMKIWDIRKLEGPLQSYTLRSPAHELNFSYKGLLSVGMGNVVEVYKDCCRTAAKSAYLRHVMNNTIGNMQFCPHEDVLGVATAKGFASLLVPGAGEANYDALEVNPYQTKEQRREAEVKALLEKIQPDLITLDQSMIAQVDLPTLKDKVEAKKKLLYLKPQKLNMAPRVKKGHSSVQILKSKKIVQETAKRDFVRDMKKSDIQNKKNVKDSKAKKTNTVLDRFL